MSEQLAQEICEPCRTGGTQVSDVEADNWLEALPEWHIKKVNDIAQLVREFKFKNFKQALVFTNKIGEVAEQEGHHPGLLTEWGKVTVSWWTHAVNGLHKNDFIMAAKTDAVFADK